ncbi:MAG: PAS domain S-box protein [Methanoregula sp.]|nr:PAS domain S-box protein [Methanoregula sp.]
MKKHSDDNPDRQEQRDKIIGLEETSLRKSGYPELREKILELERKNEELHAANEQLASREEELRQNYDELIRQEHELRENELRYRTLVETTDTGFVIVDTEGRVVDANQIYVQLSGHCELAEILGRSVVEWTADYEKERNLKAVARCAKDGFIRNFEIDYTGSSGKITPIEINATVVTYGNTSRILTLCRDITDRRKTEQALRESEIFYRTVFNTTGSASVIIENDTTISRANEGFARLSGYPVEEIEGKHRWTEFVVPDDLKRMRTYHDNRRDAPAHAPDTYEFRFTDRQGEVRHCISHVAMIPGTTRSIASLVDISDRVFAEHALEEKNRELHTACEDLSQNEEELRQNYEELSARERQLRESEHRNATLLHAIPDMMFVISREGIYRDFSVPDTNVLALPVDQILGRNIRDTGFGDESADAIMHHIGLALETGTLQQFEYELTLPQGKRQYEARMVAFSEDSVLGIVRDITERKQGEAVLQKLSTELQLILKSMINAFVIWESVFDENGNYVSFRFGYFNDSYARIANVKLEDVQGKDVFEIWPETETSWLDVYRDVALTGKPKTFEMYHAPTKGIYHCNAYRPQETPDRICVIFEDITERKRAEEELQRNYDELIRKEQELRIAKTHLEAIYDGSPDLLFVHAPDGHVIDVNENVLRAYGLTREEILSTNPDETSGRGYTAEMALGYIRSALEKGQAEFNWVSRRENGEEFPVEVRLRRIESVNEKGIAEPCILAIVRDVTERRMAEKALEQARKKLGLLNTVIFQDIQSTIFALSAYLQLANSNRDEAKAKSFAEKEAFLIHKIVSSLNFAKNYQEMGIHPPRWQNVNQVFLYAISHLDSLKVSRDIRVDQLEIFADPLLENVFFNLLENIFLHGQGVTAISLSCKEADNGLLVILTDNGIGIPDEEKLKIFERGYGKNTGLGLFLVREILSITGITIRETGVAGEGARFEILVPKGACRFPDQK